MEGEHDRRLRLEDYDVIGRKKKELRENFDKIDTDKSGKISKGEIEKTENRDLKDILADSYSDADLDGLVTYDELWCTYKNTYYSHLRTAEESFADRIGYERYMLREQFQDLDKDGSGSLTREELGHIKHCEDLFTENDHNKDDKITFDEMWASVRDDLFADIPEEVNLRAFFHECDNDDGYLTWKEIKKNIRSKAGEELAASLSSLEVMDTDKDGRVSMEEFLDSWRKGNRQNKKEKEKKDTRLSLKDFDELGKAKADLKEVFKKLDVDKSGKISLAEAKKCKEYSLELQNARCDKDGNVTFRQLWNCVKNCRYALANTAEQNMANRVASERDRLRHRFFHLDRDESGHLSMGEIYQEEGEDSDLLNNFRNTIDKDLDDKMTFDEMWAYVRDIIFVNVPEEVNLRAFFMENDRDRSGYLDKHEIDNQLYWLKNESLVETLKKGMAMDTDKDGRVSMEEFLDNWRKEQRNKKAAKKSKRTKPNKSKR